MPKKLYEKPKFKSISVKLGVFGEYGGSGNPGGQIEHQPGKIINPFDYTID